MTSEALREYMRTHVWHGKSALDRFYEKVTFAPGSCWEWTGAKQASGHGRFSIAGKSYAAARVSYMLSIGPIPNGLGLDHLCRNPACVCPLDVEPTTQKENVNRGISHLPKALCKRGHEFSKHGVLRSGQRLCLACKNASDRRYRRDHQIQMDEYQRRYREVNREARNATFREYYQVHREAQKAAMRERARAIKAGEWVFAKDRHR